ncbi:hypothetical protein [Vibrio diabolicus]|uniref:hypothetical protein n=1 Tax=Vibrio diabolicus TaxID=50719 RepID=UPI000CE9A521|nr:hypothetical protein [Vibrio diabolicus]AVF61880.1 hypothetical protein AL537_21505 [Vibrio diabolicus]
MNTQLIAGQAIPLTPDGNWLYLKSAQAEIEIYRESSGERVTLGKSSVFNVGEGKHLGRLLISSRTDNQIEIQFGFGMFTPPVEGQSVVVQALPNVVIEQMPSVTVEHLPAVEIAPNQQLAVSQLPAVHIAANQQLAVSALPAVELAANQKLAVTSLPSVEVSALPAVTLEATQVVKVNEQVSGNLITEAVSVFPHNIAQNATRKAITIKAAKANSASVFIDAFELEAGERITIESTAAMTLTGTAGDTVTTMEI